MARNLTSAEREALDASGLPTAVIDLLKTTLGKLESLTVDEASALDQSAATITELQILDGATVTTAELNILGGVTSTAAELNLLDGAAVGNSVASKVAMVDASNQLQTAANTGTAGTGVTAVEYGDGFHHTTVLTLAATVPAIAGGAALGVGNLIYTLPAGACIIDGAYMSAAITQADGNITADTPDVGIGTVIASGAVSILSGTATFENIVTGQAAADCNGTATVVTAIPTAAVPLVVEAGDAHTVHLNVADTWAASGDTGASLTGTVVLTWRFLA